jgi:cytochrome P450
MSLEAQERDYFTDHEILKDSNEYFAEMLDRGPVVNSTLRDLVIVTGFDECIEVLRNSDDFSSVVSAGGPIAPLPFVPSGDDITAQIEAHRSQFPATELMVTYDDVAHANSRFIVNKLFVPSRLKANQAFVQDFTQQLARDAAARGGCEFIGDIAVPFVTIVIAQLLGLPAEDRDRFAAALGSEGPPGSVDDAEVARENTGLMFIAREIAKLVHDRRANQRDDILTELAQADYPDGTRADVDEVIMLATFLFGAGQDTSAKFLGNCMRFLVEDLALQQELRADPAKIPSFMDEVLRLEGPTKATFRIAKRNSSIGGVPIPAGKRVAVLLGAANLDKRRWQDPEAFQLDRPKLKEHLSFGRGKHTCVGAPLARLEVRSLLEALLQHSSEIAIDEERHGPPGHRQLDYEPSYIIRGIEGWSRTSTSGCSGRGESCGERRQLGRSRPRPGWLRARGCIRCLLDHADYGRRRGRRFAPPVAPG